MDQPCSGATSTSAIHVDVDYPDGSVSCLQCGRYIQGVGFAPSRWDDTAAITTLRYPCPEFTVEPGTIFELEAIE